MATDTMQIYLYNILLNEDGLCTMVNERQASYRVLHMVGREERSEKTAANQTKASNLQIYSQSFSSWAKKGIWRGNGSMDAGGDLGSAAKGLAIGLEAACSGLVSCRFFIPLIFLLLTMCSSL